MNWPNWMKDKVWQWMTVIILAFIGIIVSIVLFLFSSTTPPIPSITGDDNVQIIGSPGTTVSINKIDSEELASKIYEKLRAKNIDANPQLVSELKDKIQILEKELKDRATKDKRAEEALVASKAGDYDKAIELFETLQEEGKEKESELASIAFNLGNVYFIELDFQKALEAYLDAVRLAPNNTAYLNEAGKSLYTLAQYDKAIEYYEKALKSDLKTFGEDHPQVAIYRNNLGVAWNAKGKYDKAIEYYEKSLESDLKTFGEDHPMVAIYRNNLGEAWYAKGEYDTAIEYFEKSLTSGLKTFGEEHPDVAIRWNNLGAAWMAKGEYDKAIEHYEKALKSDLKTFGEEHPNVARDWNNLGAVWHAKGEYDKAIEYYEKALKSDLKTFSEEHPNVAIDWN
ncbi:MAG: tetratricopeptide repeat protein, partial [Candidatus Scalindua sp.]